MKKLLYLFICICSTYTSWAQSQTGYVRTLERPHQPSVGIEGVTVNILEYPNDIVSKKQGKFSFAISGKKQGESFTLTRIEKKGYTLVDKQLRGRRFAYSSSVPLEIVMVSNQQFEKDKRQIEKKAIEKARKNYEQRIDELQAQLRKKTINEQEHEQQLEKLAKDYDNYLSLIDKLAERYALSDYKGLSDINRQINECIENAELERADSLINSKGSFDEREQQILEQQQFTQKLADRLTQSQQELDIKRNDLAQDYFNKHAILAARYQNDSAAHYLVRRAYLDTTNVDWLCDAASLMKDIGHLDEAIGLLMMAHNQCVASGISNNQHGIILETIADACYSKSDYSNAKTFYLSAIEVFEKLNPKHSHLVYCYDRVYVSLIHDSDDFTQSAHIKAQRIQDEIFDEQEVDINNILLKYVFALGGDEKAIHYYERVLAKVDSTYGANSEIAAKVHINLGMTYKDIDFLGTIIKKGNLNKVIEHFETASSILNAIDSLHPDLRLIYHNLAYIYLSQTDTATAVLLFNKAVHLLKTVYSTHPDLGTEYRSLGGIYYQLHDYPKALECYFHALDNDKRVYGENNVSIINIIEHISDTYRDMGDYEKALEYLQKSKIIHDCNQTINHDSTYNNYYSYYSKLGDIYFLQKDYPKALDAYHGMANSSQNPNGLEYLLKTGAVYLCQSDTAKALEYFKESFTPIEELSVGIQEDLRDYISNTMTVFENHCINHKYADAVNCYNATLHYLLLNGNNYYRMLISLPAKFIIKMMERDKVNIESHPSQ